MFAPFWLAAKLVLLLGGLLLPGAVWMRVLRVPRTVATCFAGSAFTVYATVLALQFASVRIAFGSLAAGLALLTGALLLVARFRAAREPAPSVPTPTVAGLWIARFGKWTPLYAVFWLIVLGRAWHEPLAGPDIEFRWNFLAEQMLQLGSLDFYPPRSAADFSSYFWVESIPPGISALYAWSYACAGLLDRVWTVPVVLLQLWSLHELLWLTAEKLGGLRAARFACLVAAACPLLTWSALLGQETGLTALALAGLAYAFVAWDQARTPGTAVLAGIFATLGAVAREYGLIFPLLAVAVLLLRRAPRGTWCAFLGAAALSLVWPLRTWLLTGNPFYSLALGPAFPINPRFVAWIEREAVAYGAVLRTLAGWRDVFRYLLLYAPPALVGWLVLALAVRRRVPWAAVALGATVVLLGVWFASVRYTNGGLFYTTRVTSPALALGALVAGLGLAALAEKRPALAPALAVTTAVWFVVSLAGTLGLPRNPWNTPLRDWPAFTAYPSLFDRNTDETIPIVLQAMTAAGPAALAPANTLVVVDGAGFQRRFLGTGIRIVPPWSPEVDWLFDRTLSPATLAQRWRESGLRYIILTKWQDNLDYFNELSRWAQPPFRVRILGGAALTVVFVIEASE